MAEDKDQATYSLWLMPADDDAAWLDALIVSAAPIFGTPPFRAHLTIQGDLAWPPEELRRVAETLALSCPALDWPIAGVECSAHYFRSLFVRLQPCDAFAQLRSTAARLTGSEQGLSPFPHVSLAYDEPERAQDKGVLQARFAARLSEERTLRIASLALARSSKDLPIAQWRVLETFPLR